MLTSRKDVGVILNRTRQFKITISRPIIFRSRFILIYHCHNFRKEEMKTVKHLSTVQRSWAD